MTKIVKNLIGDLSALPGSIIIRFEFRSVPMVAADVQMMNCADASTSRLVPQGQSSMSKSAARVIIAVIVCCSTRHSLREGCLLLPVAESAFV